MSLFLKRIRKNDTKISGRKWLQQQVTENGHALGLQIKL